MAVLVIVAMVMALAHAAALAVGGNRGGGGIAAGALAQMLCRYARADATAAILPVHNITTTATVSNFSTLDKVSGKSKR